MDEARAEPRDDRSSTSRVVLRIVGTGSLGVPARRALRALLDAAFAGHEDGPLRDEDWRHALGGRHVIAELDGRPIGHAAIVERVLHVAGRPVRTGYVEAVAVEPAWQGHGLGTAVMRAVHDEIQAGYELGALATGSQPFYERLGWQRWRGPSAVRTDAGDIPTPEDDGGILVLVTPATPFEPLPLEASITCERRPGDPW